MAEAFNKKQMRSSQFELLRIVSMFIIVLYHSVYYGGFSFDTSFSANELVTQMMSIFGKLGVNLFVLISGYFLCTKTDYRWKSIVKFVLQVTVFLILINTFFFIKNPETFSIKAVIKTCFPFIFSEWWFASTYFVFSLFTPLLSKLTQVIDKTQHLAIIGVLFVLWSVIPTVLKQYVQSNEVLFFVFLFLIASYIRKYPKCFTGKNKFKLFLSLTLVMFAIFAIGFLALNKLSEIYPPFSAYIDIIVSMQSVPMIILSVSIFCMFANMRPFISKGVNFVASCSFGIYLLHDHGQTRNLLWNGIFDNSHYQNSPTLILRLVLSATIVFAVCLIISVIYKLTLEKLFDKILDKLSPKAQAFTLKIKDKIKPPQV